MVKIQLADEQQNALAEMLSGQNIFLTGEAGTGKSTIVQEFKRRTSKNCVFLAPTGIAAVNIGGCTIHSFLRLVPGLQSEDSITPIASKNHRELIRNVDVIVIDEISMVRADLFWAIDYRLRQVMRGADKKRPFGGKQVILVGDFYQLPPVVKSEEEERTITETLGGISAFQAPNWDRANFRCFCLKTVHRQGNDNMFLSILNHIRHGDISSRDFQDTASGELLNVKEMLNRHTNISIPLAISPICLCTTNREANILNTLANEKSPEPSQTFTAVVKGKFSESDYPTPVKLDLKIGSRVMTLINRRNSSGDLEFVNGDIGEVIGFQGPPGSVFVEIKLDNGRTVMITPNEWKNYEYILTPDLKTGKAKVEQKEIGSFIQYPLRLAYAMTIHKSQGMSVDSVLIKLGNGCFAHGQLYTALSRCRSLKNMRIDRSIYDEDIILNQAVVDFYRKIETRTEAPQTVSLDIPVEYQDAVRELLAKLRGGEGKSVVREPKQITSHQDIDRLLTVYYNQTDDEQNESFTDLLNGVGFNKIDAPILTELAEKYISKGCLIEDELAIVSARIKKYHRQWS